MAGHRLETLSRWLLLGDGAGCLAGAAAVAGVRDLARAVDPSGRARFPLALAMGLTGAGLLMSSRAPAPERSLRPAAAVNAAWVCACLAGLPGRSGTGRLLVGATAVLDGVAGLSQVFLARRLSRVGS